MKFIKKHLKKTIHLVKDNYLISIFCLVIFFIGCVVLFKIVTKKDKTIYVQVKVSQGLWWASTMRPSIWLADSLKKGDKELGLSGNPNVEIKEVRTYPLAVTGSPNEQYDVFLIVKMKAGFNSKTGKYTFKRSAIAIGSPIEFEFSNTAITGIVMNISDEPFKQQYEEKTVIFQKELAQQWEYDSIVVGDTYADGETVVLEVVDKHITETYDALNSVGANYPVFSGKRLNFTMTVKMKLKKQGINYLFREEVPIIRGRRLNLPVSQFVLNELIITDIR